MYVCMYSNDSDFARDSPRGFTHISTFPENFHEKCEVTLCGKTNFEHFLKISQQVNKVIWQPLCRKQNTVLIFLLKFFFKK